MKTGKYSVTVKRVGAPEVVRRVVCDGALIVTSCDTEDKPLGYVIGGMMRAGTILVAIGTLCWGMPREDVVHLRDVINSVFDEAERAADEAERLAAEGEDDATHHHG